MTFRRKNTESFDKIFAKYFAFKNETKSLEPLLEVFSSMKRSPIEDFITYLKAEPKITANFSYYLKRVFEGKPLTLSLTEANILSESAFFPELRKRIINTVLPPVENEDTVWHLVDYVSVSTQKDLEYFKSIGPENIDALFSLLGISDFIKNVNIKKELYLSMNILAWRTIGNALEVEVVKMAPEYKNFDNPFVALQNEVDKLTETFKENPEFNPDKNNPDYKQIKVYLKQCLNFVTIAFKNSSKYGISGKINQSLIKIRQQLNRISDILGLLEVNTAADYEKNSKQLVYLILDYKSHKNNIRELFAESTGLLSHLITNHTAETGVHYIASTTKDYIKMFWKAAGGGVIVGALVVIKTFFSYLGNSDFSHAVLYSLNYAFGFIAIYLLHFTLATKQPAMTAATMAKVLSEEKNTQKNYRDFAHLVAKLFRTQFIAFVGNVLLAFPVAMGIIYTLELIYHKNFAQQRAPKLLYDLNPFESNAILHACVAGFYLFISGIIAGNVGNNSVFYHIPKRIAKNPTFIRLFGQKFAVKLSKFYSRNWAGIISNFWFGVFLGSTASIGNFFGLDLDIRHITFAAGNFALGLYGEHFKVSDSVIWISLITIVLIGICNFVVSFGLSMSLAFRSRKVKFGEVREIYKEIFRYFLNNPLKFFLPIRSVHDNRAREMVEKTVPKQSQEQ